MSVKFINKGMLILINTTKSPVDEWNDIQKALLEVLKFTDKDNVSEYNFQVFLEFLDNMIPAAENFLNFDDTSK